MDPKVIRERKRKNGRTEERKSDPDTDSPDANGRLWTASRQPERYLHLQAYAFCHPKWQSLRAAVKDSGSVSASPHKKATSSSPERFDRVSRDFLAGHWNFPLKNHRVVPSNSITISMTQSDLTTVLGLLEGLTLSPSEASEVLSAIHISVSPDSTVTMPVVTAPPVPTLLDSPVTTVKVNGQTIYRKTYKGTDFDVPKEDSEGPFYVITKGYRIGIIDNWGFASDAVTGVSGAVFCKVDTMEAALAKMLRAIDSKAAKVLEKK
ncbi:hypothetical protein L210DRAFT_3641242 [Boletus edulis BED1]|uniref:Ribonuclease H1 N-terminal domain-containing protein n=1 Tax=Boletus edulis BED1 TaxID=1328754 RepID=A0AAD4C3Z9_BOLED|nr:hypothetical protein L210DRAFT_3641242 [Boletus edulis BED1]